MDASTAVCRAAAGEAARVAAVASGADAAAADTAAAAAARRVDLLSPASVGHLLYEVLRHPPPPGAGRLRSGGFSTGGRVLDSLCPTSRAARAVRAHRAACNLLAVAAELAGAVAAGLKDDGVQASRRGVEWLLGGGNMCRVAQPRRPWHLPPTTCPPISQPHAPATAARVRGNFRHTAAATGRLAMDGPNLQTVPKGVAFDTDVAGPGCPSLPVDVRRAFVAPAGWVLLSADYRQAWTCWFKRGGGGWVWWASRGGRLSGR